MNSKTVALLTLALVGIAGCKLGEQDFNVKLNVETDGCASADEQFSYPAVTGIQCPPAGKRIESPKENIVREYTDANAILLLGAQNDAIMAMQLACANGACQVPGTQTTPTPSGSPTPDPTGSATPLPAEPPYTEDPDSDAPVPEPFPLPSGQPTYDPAPF